MKPKQYVGVFGGLGNQLFQLAFSDFLNTKFGLPTELIDLTGDFSLDRGWQLCPFGVEHAPLSKSAHYRIKTKSFISRGEKLLRRGDFNLRGRISGVLDDNNFDPTAWEPKKSYIFLGYWQKFDFARYTRSRMLSRIDKLDRLFSSDPVIQNILSSADSLVIHIRRGDYVSNPSARLRHFVCDEDYYRNALTKFFPGHKLTDIWVFSDDIKYVQDNYTFLQGANFVCEPASSPHIDLQRMRVGNNFIISNSTYSWWAGFLSERAGSIVAPNHWHPGVLSKDLGIVPGDWRLA